MDLSHLKLAHCPETRILGGVFILRVRFLDS
jgi:hypothetical protein